jgi:RNA polymerase sigma-70 factor, ECF subfamily
VPTTETIWADFHRELLGFLTRRVRDPELARDLLQEVFVKIHLKLPTLTQTDRLGAWVYRITRNTLLDSLKSPRHAAPAELPDELAPEEITSDLTLELVRCLGPFLRELPEPARQALLTTELGALSQKEYAAQLGLSYSGTKSRVQRAKQQLHALFSDCCHISADRYGHVLDIVPRDPCGCRVC